MLHIDSAQSGIACARYGHRSTIASLGCGQSACNVEIPRAIEGKSSAFGSHSSGNCGCGGGDDGYSSGIGDADIAAVARIQIPGNSKVSPPVKGKEAATSHHVSGKGDNLAVVSRTRRIC